MTDKHQDRISKFKEVETAEVAILLALECELLWDALGNLSKETLADISGAIFEPKPDEDVRAILEEIADMRFATYREQINWKRNSELFARVRAKVDPIERIDNRNSTSV